MRYQSIIKIIFFGNYFYGICAVALAIEASLQQHYPINDVIFYTALFAATTWYYTKAYVTEQTALTVNQRTNWYIQYKNFVNRSQLILEIILGICLVFFVISHGENLLHLRPIHFFLVLVFPVIAGLYYGIETKIIGNFNLRKIGWVKPFVIGFTWAGLVTVYPVVYYWIVSNSKPEITLINLFLFVKNFMFVTVLCIMFDIKDYAMDYNSQLKTFVVNHGLRKTIFYILIPLSVAGLGSFLIYGFIRDFSIQRMILNTIPFLLMIMVAYSMHRRKRIMYYLILIDGLMLVKAICGSIGVIFF
jgi:hypothetical protein